ncbi:ubiquilin-1-like [Paramacrobiotus metropolitanus]|uniref:ubiquilin-1-like n=1 Tax=Paramacrobiotus metropolitanus TaxID=2943436 RepID=UPI0024458609|nr:ubiquilin-1-like [Paramacrobiotus metropolitanus]
MSSADQREDDQRAPPADDAAMSADGAAPGTASEQWKLKIKTPSLEKEVEVDPNSTVKTVREAVSAVFEQPFERLCLVYGGKIMKDEDTLQSYGVRNHHSIHLVVRVPQRPAAPATATHPVTPTSGTPTGQPANTPPGARPTNPSANPLGGLPGMAGMSGMNMEQLLDNPLIQNMFSNPDMIRNVVSSNPQIQNLVERHPELGHALNNPDVIRQAMQVMRNPAMMQEMMRNYDRALSNLESLPGGFNALQRFYNDYQEPMYNAMNNQNPFATLRNEPPNTEAPRAENTEPLPNPWGGGGAGAAPTPAAGGAPRAPNPFAALAGAGAPGGMQAMMNQLSANPQLMERALQNMNNPEYVRLVSDPRGMTALRDLNQSYRTLHELAPTLFPFNLPFTIPGQPPGAGAGGVGQGLNLPPAAGGGNAMLEQMFQSMLRAPPAGGGAAAGAAPVLPPEERFRNELVTLESMGFTDRAANIRALEATFGDVTAAVERLLQGGAFPQ